MEISAFIPRTQVDELTSDLTPEDREILLHSMESIFLMIGRVPNYEVMLGSHPQYLDHHSNLLIELFTFESALPGKWKYYLAFMSAACHQCEYFMSLEKELCCLSGGNSEWFDAASLQQLPQKIRDIGSVNGILAHRPWELTSEDLRALLGSWTVTELVEALVALCVFHSLSSLVLGLGVLPEFDLPCPRRRKSSLSSVLDQLHRPEIASQLLVESRSVFHPPDDEDHSEYFEAMAGCSLAFTNYSGQGTKLYPSDFNWRDHGYAMLEKMLPTVATRLNVSSQYANHFTLRDARWRAAWLYTQRLYGLEYDDYNYREVNQELQKSTKAFLKKVACLPHEVTAEDWGEVDLTTQEKVTLVLVVSEARREGELLYALHALRALL